MATKDYSIEELMDFVKNRPDMLDYALYQLYNKGAISESQVRDILLQAGYKESSPNHFVLDDSTKLQNFIHKSLGPTLAAIGFTGVGAGAMYELFKGDKQSNTDVDYTPAKYGGTAYAGQTITGDSASFPTTGNWFDSIMSAIGNAFEKFSGNGLMATVTGIGSQFANSALNMRNTEKLIDKMNEYNTPANQMQRFADAGLNPNLVYGLGSNGNQGNAGTIAPVDFDTSQRENRMAQMQFDLSKKQVEADIAQKQSAVNLNNANAAEADARRVAQENTNSIFEMQMQIVGAQLDQAIAEADLALKEAHGWKEKRDAELALIRAQKAKAQFDSQSHSKAGGLFWDIVNLSKGLNEDFKNAQKTWTPDRIAPITPPVAGR